MNAYGASSEYFNFKGGRTNFLGRNKCCVWGYNTGANPTKKDKRRMKHSYRHKQKLMIDLFLYQDLNGIY